MFYSLSSISFYIKELQPLRAVQGGSGACGLLFSQTCTKYGMSPHVFSPRMLIIFLYLDETIKRKALIITVSLR